MTDYAVRVELFDADSDKYEKLYEGMSKIGFRKTIQAVGGPVRMLPTGTYVGSSQSGIADVRVAVSRIADPISSKAAAVFVCELTNWASYLYTDS
ncbi:DUF2622 domain-containing protein [Symbiopectobacterium purcellii]|uniref:DUF2622 domain-containing protein n=1 Tax=Symbiopectobacterium purcellii TaxID=2871826 RepID=A0ABX9AIQ6_9ENTR|nr:DUF2622 domain-containing protein [Symbiopectobacterium purcellii]QZN94141.1 DUF2622 domain-containing protein [Symbiopectobacterium purcellii]